MGDTDGSISRTLGLVHLEPELAFYRRQLKRESPTLLLGCATGPFAWALAREGPVVAVDPSERMLEAAEALRENEPTEVQGRIRFVRADLRALRLPQRFAVVIAAQNALGGVGALEDLETALATVRGHLEPSGVFAYDLRQAPEVTARRVDEPGARAFLEPARPTFTPHLREARHGPIRRLLTRSYSPGELDRAFERAGLTELERYGDFAGKPLEDGDRLRVGVATVE